MDAAASSNESLETSRSAIAFDFWDRYKAEGLEAAHAQFELDTESNDELIRSIVPDIVAEARNRGIDLIHFLKEWEVYMEKVNALRVDNRSSELRPVSVDEAVEPQDEDGAASARDADGESSGSAEGV